MRFDAAMAPGRRGRRGAEGVRASARDDVVRNGKAPTLPLSDLTDQTGQAEANLDRNLDSPPAALCAEFARLFESPLGQA